MEPGNYKHRLLIENLPDAFAYHQIITDEKMTGLSMEQVIGKKATELNPGIENYSIDWIGRYRNVNTSRAPLLPK